MDRIVGKLIISVVLLCGSYVYGSLSLQVTDIQGNSVHDVQAGEMFLVLVSASDDDTEIAEPKIKGMQDFYVKRVGYRMATVNGVKSVQYTYHVRIDKPGLYTIGPAYDPDTHTSSQTVRVKVEAGTHSSQAKKSSKQRQKDKRAEPVLLRLWVEQDRFFVGQQVKANLRFYVPEDEAISLEQLITQEPQNVVVSERSGPVKGQQELEGKKYVYYEWQWNMSVQQSGTIVIPAYGLDYMKHITVDRSFGLLSFFGPSYERKRVYSNALTLHIAPLPSTDKQVQAVGHFSRYQMYISPSVAKQYEGMVLSLSIEGDGNMQAIEAPELIGMPEDFKWYPSKHYIEPSSFGQKKVFEYIIQSLKEGEWEIPAQHFSFFDVSTANYKELRSSSSFITVLPGTLSMKEYIKEEKVEDTITSVPSASSMPILYAFDQYEQQPHLSWFWFFVCAVLPILFMMGAWITHMLYRVMHYIAPHYTKKRAFSYAQKQLACAYQQHNTQALYAIFIQLFALRKECAITSLSIHEINTIIQSSNLSDEHKQKWQTFFAAVAEVAYAGSAAPKEILRLFHEAAIWLQELERAI